MEEWIDYMINEENKIVLDRDGGLIAFFIKNKECYITDFYVKENFRGTGLGLKLAKDALNYAKDLECNIMTCNVFINEANKNMFSHKIRIFSEFGFLPQMASNDAVTMVKEIQLC